jgi:hypothetical protein
MIPSTELRLKTMMRALTESILPALDPENSLAQEQAGLLMGHINALIQQQGLEYQVNEQEAEAMTDLAKQLLTIAEGGVNTVAAAERLAAAMKEGNFEELSKSVERLLSMEDGSQAFKDATWKPVLDYSRNAAARGQQWFKPMGF